MKKTLFRLINKFGLWLIIPVILVFWVAGAHAFKTSWWIFENFFGDITNLENIFSPQNALFSAVSAAFIIITFRQQIKQFSVQNFATNFMDMLNMHIATRAEISYPFDKSGERRATANRDGHSKGISAFIDYYNLYQVICSKYISRIKPGKETYLTDELEREIEDNLGMLQINDSPPADTSLFEIAHRTFDSFTERRLWHYYKQLYRLIKYTYENAPKESRKNYLGMIRANLSTHEHALIYYNALMVKDYEDVELGKPKFQVLIEKTSMLHNFPDEIKFDEGIAGEYAEEAYKNNED